MSDETSAPAGGEAIAADAPVQDSGGDLSLSQAARLLAQHRNKPRDEAPVEQPQADPVEQDELAQANADPETDPSEATPDAEPADQPPIEPPRSWTKAEKERFQSLPRETQEYLHTREQEREREFRRSQNEIAETRKATLAEREQVEKARLQYEAKTKSAEQALFDSQHDRFPDIKSMEDIERLSRTAREIFSTDPYKALEIQNYLTDFNVHQQRLQSIASEARQAEARQAQETQSKWTDLVQKENSLAAEHIPELADKVKGPALEKRAAERLNELGFKPEELAELASGRKMLPIYDHRIQRLIFSDLKLSDIQSASKAVATKPVPPVQRPGTARPQGNAASTRIQALEEKLTRTGSLRDAQALRAAQLARR